MYYTAVSFLLPANVFLFTHQNQFLLTFGAWPVLILDPDWDSIEKEKWHDTCCWRSMQLTRKCLFSHSFFSPRNTLLFGFWGKFVYDWDEFVCFWPGQTIFNPAVNRLTQRGSPKLLLPSPEFLSGYNMSLKPQWLLWLLSLLRVKSLSVFQSFWVSFLVLHD